MRRRSPRGGRLRLRVRRAGASSSARSPCGASAPSTRGPRAPVTLGTPAARSRSVAYPSTANAIASFASGSMPNASDVRTSTPGSACAQAVDERRVARTAAAHDEQPRARCRGAHGVGDGAHRERRRASRPRRRRRARRAVRTHALDERRAEPLASGRSSAAGARKYGSSSSSSSSAASGVPARASAPSRRSAARRSLRSATYASIGRFAGPESNAIACGRTVRFAIPPRLSATHGALRAEQQRVDERHERRARPAGRRVGGAEVVDDGRADTRSRMRNASPSCSVWRASPSCASVTPCEATASSGGSPRDAAHRVAERLADRRVQRRELERADRRGRAARRGCARAARRRTAPSRSARSARATPSAASRARRRPRRRFRRATCPRERPRSACGARASSASTAASATARAHRAQVRAAVVHGVRQQHDATGRARDRPTPTFR